MPINSEGVELLKTGIPGFDLLSMGGLPLYRTTLVLGTAGAGKTIFATQFLVEGIRLAAEPCVFVTFEESPADIRADMLSLGWDIAAFEAAGTWRFVDGSLSPAGEGELLIGDYDLGGLLSRIQAAITRIGAKRLAMDALASLLGRFSDGRKVRSELLRISRAVRDMGVTSVMTSERTSEYTEMSRYGVEEFIADNVIIVRSVLEMERRRRTLEILKMRGVPHRRGEFPFVVVNGRGIEVVPLSAVPLQHKSTTIRTTFGNEELDRMCGGGLLRDSITMVSGQTGVGKTLMATEFAAGGGKAGERCLFLGFEESRDQLFRNAAAWGHDFERLEAEGWLRVVCEYPESASLEDRLVRIKDMLMDFRPDRVVLDTLSALHRSASGKTFRDFVLGLTSVLKQDQVTALFIVDIGPILGAATVMGEELSAFTDSIILLRYVEIGSRMYRCLTILKMRASPHQTEVREFSIDGTGMHIGPPFLQVQGVLTGSGLSVAPQPIKRQTGKGNEKGPVKG